MTTAKRVAPTKVTPKKVTPIAKTPTKKIEPKKVEPKRKPTVIDRRGYESDEGFVVDDDDTGVDFVQKVIFYIDLWMEGSDENGEFRKQYRPSSYQLDTKKDKSKLFQRINRLSSQGEGARMPTRLRIQYDLISNLVTDQDLHPQYRRIAHKIKSHSYPTPEKLKQDLKVYVRLYGTKDEVDMIRVDPKAKPVCIGIKKRAKSVFSSGPRKEAHTKKVKGTKKTNMCALDGERAIAWEDKKRCPAKTKRLYK